MNRMNQLLAATALVCAAAAVPAAAQTAINFDDGTAGNVVGSFYAGQGVTFSGASFYSNLGLTGASGGLAIASTTQRFQFGPDNPIIGTFSGLASTVSIRGLDVGSAGIRLEAYNAANVLLGFDQFFGPDVGVGTFRDVTVTFANIKSFRVFQPLSAAGTNAAGDGMLLDNLSFNATAVPEPAAWAMMIAGMGAVGFAMRRRQKVVTRVTYA